MAWLPRAHAEPLALSWSAPAGCPRADAVRARIRRLLERAGSRSNARGLTVRATVVRAADQFVLSLAIETSAGLITRELQAHDCSLLSESAAVLVELASAPDAADAVREPSSSAVAPPLETTADNPLDPRAEAPSSATADTAPTPPEQPQFDTPEAATSANTTALDASDAPESSVARAAPRLPWAARVSVGAGLFASGLPGPRPDLFTELALELRALSAGLRFGHVFGGSRDLGANTSVRYFADYLALNGCGRWGNERVLAGPCLGLLGSRSHAATSGLTDARARNALWAQVGLGASLRFRLSARSELGLEAGLLLPLTARPQFNVVNVGTLEQGNVVSGYSHIDLGIRFE